MKNYFFKHALLPTGWVENVRINVDSHGLISQLSVATRARYHDNAIDCAVPMLPNCHSHVFQRTMAGLTEYKTAKHDSFWSWRDLMYNYANKIDANQLYHIACYVYAEMLSAGFDSVCEFHYIHRDISNKDDTISMSQAILKAANEVGIGLTFLPVLYTQSHCDGSPLSDLQQRFQLSVDDYCHLYRTLADSLYAGQRLGICFHSLRAVSVEQIHQVLNELDDGQQPIHIHIAEQKPEIEQIVTHFGKSPVELLFAEFAVNEQWCLVHATHLNNQEIALIANSKAVVGLCPLTEANLGDGVFPMPQFLQKKGVFAIGSDSNIVINPMAELQMLEYSQRLTTQQRNICCEQNRSVASFLWNAVLKGGSRASGLSSSGLAVGNAANFMAIGDDSPLLTGLNGDDRFSVHLFCDAHLTQEIYLKGERQTKITAQYRENYRKTLKSLR